MKRWSHISLFAIICAAIVVGAWSGVLLCDWLDPIPDEEALLVEKAHERVRESKSSPAIAEAARPTRSSRGVRGKGWIADAWSGPRRTGAFRVAGVSADGRVEAQCVDAGGARRGFGETIRRALRKRGKAPLEDRFARRAENPFDTPEARHHSHGSDGGPTIYEGDVYISGLPMVDQGNRAYCAVASAARVLQGYGIEVTMDDLAAMAHSSETGGTHPYLWENAISQVAGEHGLELKAIPELTEMKTPLTQLVGGYNELASEMGYGELALSDYVYPIGPRTIMNDYKAFDLDREYPVQREVMLSSNSKCDAFDENVTARIDESDPLFWSVLLGDIPEQTAYGEGTYLEEGRGGHMRLIIGYNEDRGEVLYSDSWGEGHELKRMDAQDALSITKGMYYLTDQER